MFYRPFMWMFWTSIALVLMYSFALWKQEQDCACAHPQVKEQRK